MNVYHKDSKTILSLYSVRKLSIQTCDYITIGNFVKVNSENAVRAMLLHYITFGRKSTCLKFQIKYSSFASNVIRNLIEKYDIEVPARKAKQSLTNGDMDLIMFNYYTADNSFKDSAYDIASYMMAKYGICRANARAAIRKVVEMRTKKHVVFSQSCKHTPCGMFSSSVVSM